MKMPTLPKMPKMPKLPKLPKLPKPQPKRLQATARRAAQPAMDDYDEEPTTRLSSAFVVVLILHVVAVGGIYAFNSIKAHRRGQEVASSTSSSTEPVRNTAPTTPNASAPVEQAAPNGNGGASVAAASIAPAQSAAATATPVSPISGNRIYRVQSGDTLTRVASLYSVSREDLEQANGLKSNAVLRLGQTLNIPISKPESKPAAIEARKSEPSIAKKTETPVKTAASPIKAAVTPTKAASPSSTAGTSSTAAAGKTYTVKKGDNPVAIAKKFGVSYEELLKLNKITDPKKLRIDQTLKIPAKKGE